MMWLQPWAVWFLAGLPLIVLLYLLKVRRRPAVVSTLIFWQKVVQEHRRRALFQRLRSLLSLLLHLLIFALIVAALARPTFDHFVHDGTSTVLVIDTRARMNAVEPDGVTRFAKAIQAALLQTRDASATRQFALLAIGPQPAVLLPFTGNERTLRETLEKLQPTDAGGVADPAFALAKDLLATRRGERRTMVFTDRKVEAPEEITFQTVGSARDNAAIVRFSARPLPASPSTSEVFLEVRNFSNQPLKANLELRYDEKLLDVKPLSLEANGKQTLIFPSLPRPGANARGQFTATLDHADALACDNVARLWLPPPRPVRVLLFSNGNVFLEKALSADPSVSYEVLAPDAWDAALAAKFDVVVFDTFVPTPLPPGNCFFLQRTPFNAEGATPLEQPVLTGIDSTHPTLRLLDFNQTTILRAFPLALPPPTPEWTYTAPLTAFEQALLVVGERRGNPPQRIAALGLDLTATDLPLRIAFPLLITNTVHWLAGTTNEATAGLRAGEILLLAEGEKIALEPAVAGQFQPMRNGFYPLVRGSRSGWLAVNTFDEAEADLRGSTLSPAAPGPAATLKLPAVVSSLTTWPLWRYLALAALALFTLEWSLFHRRRTE